MRRLFLRKAYYSSASSGLPPICPRPAGDHHATCIFKGTPSYSSSSTVSAGGSHRTTPPTLLALLPLPPSCMMPASLPPFLYRCHCHVAHPGFDSHSEPPSLPSCHARHPSNLPCAQAPARQPGFFFPSHQHGQTYDSSRWMYRARRPPETAETRSRSCSVLRPSPALASQIVNTRPLRSPALLSWHRFPRPGKLRCVLREGVIPTMPRTHGFG